MASTLISFGLALLVAMQDATRGPDDKTAPELSDAKTVSEATVREGEHDRSGRTRVVRPRRSRRW